MPTRRSDLAVAVVDGKIYAMSVFDGNGTMNTVERYDPATNIWTVRRTNAYKA